jgi:hypothetical protein
MHQSLITTDYPEHIIPTAWDIPERPYCPFGCSARVDEGEPCRCHAPEKAPAKRREYSPEEKRRRFLDWGYED